jgi:hypothetical protein
MRNSRRAIAAVACALALLALPVQAAAPAGSTITIEHFESWMGTLWERFLGLLTGDDPPPLTVDLGGACIDPNGCGQQN